MLGILKFVSCACYTPAQIRFPEKMTVLLQYHSLIAVADCLMYFYGLINNLILYYGNSIKPGSR